MLAIIGAYPNSAFGLPVPNQAKIVVSNLKLSHKVATVVILKESVTVKSKPN